MHKGIVPVKAMLLAAVLILFSTPHLHATEWIGFSGGDYSIEFLIGRADKASIGRVRFSPPGDKPEVFMPGDLLRIEAFDDRKEILTVHFKNKNEPDLPPSFSLVVRKKSGVLTIGGKRIKGEFDWADF
jgi:hypothetical protein